MNVLQVNLFCQLVEAPTRNNALLYLLITNKTDLITDVEVRYILVESDHNIIVFKINHRKRRQEGSTRTLYFKSSTITKLGSILHNIRV